MSVEAKRSAKEDLVLERCRTIFNAPESVKGEYPPSQKDYDKGWTNRLTKIMQYIEAGDRGIPEILAHLNNFTLSGRWPIGERIEFVSEGRLINLLARSGYAYGRHAIAELVVAAASGSGTAILELGSGIAESLFDVWYHGRLLPRCYHACELSEAGRRATRILASLDKRLPLDVHYFDYRNPSFRGLKFKGSVVAFSRQSIEQVDHIPGEFIDRLCSIAPKVTCLHFEPIGWQFTAEPTEPFVAQHRIRCLEFNYNTNYWGLLKEKERAGQIQILEAVPYFFGYAYNPLCKIVWRSTQ